jgi:surface antigen
VFVRTHIRVFGLIKGYPCPPVDLKRLVAPFAAVVVAAFVGGCSLAIPLTSLSATEEDATGSIEKPGSPLGPVMDPEDWRRANAALGVALDPQGNGAPVQWSNPISGAKGSFVQTGRPFPFDAVVCRPFAADMALRGGEHALAGSACVDKSGEWTVRDAKPRKKT